jgi:hypothetical protein
MMLTSSGIFRNHEGLRQSHQVLERSLPAAKIECFNKLIEGEFAFLEWRAKNRSVEVKTGPIRSLFEMGTSCFTVFITKSIGLKAGKLTQFNLTEGSSSIGGRRGRETATGC